MALFSKPKTLPSAAEALPGRSAIGAPCRSITTPWARRCKAPRPGRPRGRLLRSRPLLGRGAFVLAARRVHTAVGYQGALRRTPPTRKCAAAVRGGHAEVVIVVFDPKVITFEALLECFWNEHDPTQGMRQGNDIAHQYRSAIYGTTDAQLTAAEVSKAVFETGPSGRGLRAHHHGDWQGAAVLLRRTLPPAVSLEDSRWLLRPAGHGGELPHAHGGDRPAQQSAQPIPPERRRRARRLVLGGSGRPQTGSGQADPRASAARDEDGAGPPGSRAPPPRSALPPQALPAAALRRWPRSRPQLGSRDFLELMKFAQVGPFGNQQPRPAGHRDAIAPAPHCYGPRARYRVQERGLGRRRSLMSAWSPRRRSADTAVA